VRDCVDETVAGQVAAGHQVPQNAAPLVLVECEALCKYLDRLDGIARETDAHRALQLVHRLPEAQYFNGA